MEFKNFTAQKDDDGRRLDRILRIFLRDKSLSEIYKFLRKGLIKVNNKKAKPDLHIQQGDIISIAEFLLIKESNDSSASSIASDKDFSLKIVFENEHLLIIDKPYGRSVHPAKEDKNNNVKSLADEVLQYYEMKEIKNESISFRPGPLHRLDKNTTGLLVFSMSLQGAKWFSEGIKNHTIQKKYYGLAEGKIEKTETWENNLTDSETTDNGFYTVKESSDGQKAVTIVKPVCYGKLKGHDVTLAEYTIKTGRKHQIRAQSQIHKHPLAGDKAYGGHSNGQNREYYLQAYSLSFPADNPLNLPSEIKIELSSDFLALLQYCEIENPGL